MIRCFVTLCMLTIVAAGSAVAGDDTDEKSLKDWNHAVGWFIGITAKDNDWGPSTGIEYEHRLGDRFGIAGVLEWTWADFREGIVALAFVWRPGGELRLVGAPGFNVKPRGGEGEFNFRIGGDYVIPVGGGYAIGPGLYVDISSVVAIVAGLGFAKTF